MKSKRSTGQMHAGVLWISGMGQLLLYDGESIKAAMDSDLAYVPTTATGICDMYTGASFTVAQSPNLLTGKRKNSLRGIKNDTGTHKFMLDAKASYGKPFTLTASFRVKKTEDVADEYTAPYIGKDSQGQEVNTVVTVVFHTDSLTSDVWEATASLTDSYGNDVTVTGASFTCQVTNGNELYLGFDAVSYQRDTDNITVEMTVDNTDGAELDGAELFALTTLKNGGSVMLTACGTNRLFASQDMGGLSYFPKSSVVSIGEETEKITSVLPMTESFVGVYKKNSFYRLKISTDTGTEYELYPSSDAQGSINHFSARRLGYDCLTLNRDGIFGIGDTENEEYVTTRLYNRSSAIQRELDEFSDEEIESACACVHGGAYYLFIGGRAYITYQQESGEYQWWIFDNCYATCAVSINGTLYMGRDSGDVAVFDKEYTDRQDYVLTERERDFVFSEESPSTVVFNYKIDADDGDKISLESHYLLVGEGQFSGSTRLITFPSDCLFDENGHISVYDGDEVLLIDSEGYTVHEGAITEVNPSESTVYCKSIGLNADCALKLYIKKDEKTEYTLKTLDGSLTLYHGERPATLYGTELDRVYIRKRSEIECELYTPITDLGIKGEKTLCGIIFTPSEDTRCRVKIGFETRKRSFSKSLTIGAYTDFDAVDFNDLGFNPRFKRSIRISCLERSFDYIRLWLYSDSGREVGIDSLSLIYNVNQ